MSRLRAIGIVGLYLGAGLVLSGLVARFAHVVDDATLNRYAALVQILGYPVALIGLILQMASQGRERRVPSAVDLAAAAEELASRVILKEGEEWARLLGTDRADVQVINVTFARDDRGYRHAGGDSTGDLQSILHYFHSLQPRRLVIVGEPGSGKTVLAIRLLLRIATARDGQSHSPGNDLPVPVRLNLAGYDPAQPLDEWLASQLATQHSMDGLLTRGLVRNRKVLPVLDGLDEMDSDRALVRAQAAIEQLNSYFRADERAPLVLTCRLQKYRQLEPLLDSTCICIEKLTPRQAVTYLRSQITRSSEEANWRPIVDHLARHPNRSSARAVMSVLDSPWRLTLAVAVGRHSGSPAELVQLMHGRGPVRPDVIRRANDSLMERFLPAVTARYPRWWRRYYEPIRVIAWLRTLVQHLDSRARSGGSGIDILVHDLWTIAGTHRVRLLHLPVAGVATLLTVFGVIVLAIKNDNPLTGYLGAAMAMSVLIFGLAAVALQPNRVPFHPTPRGLLTWNGLRRSLIAAVATLLVSAFAYSAGSGLVDGLVAGLVGGVLAGLTFGLFLGIASRSAGAALTGAFTPRDPFDHCLAVSVPVGLLLGSLSGAGIALMGNLVYGIAFAPVYALCIALMFGLPVGSIAWHRHMIGMAVLAVTGRLPFAVASFLNWSHASGILRASGIAYQFRHQAVQDYLGSTHSNQ